MLTANYLCVPHDLQPFVMEGKDGPFAPILMGAIDAPEVIPAGSHERCLSVDESFEYGISTAVSREQQ